MRRTSADKILKLHNCFVYFDKNNLNSTNIDIVLKAL